MGFNFCLKNPNILPKDGVYCCVKPWPAVGESYHLVVLSTLKLGPTWRLEFVGRAASRRIFDLGSFSRENYVKRCLCSFSVWIVYLRPQKHLLRVKPWAAKSQSQAQRSTSKDSHSMLLYIFSVSNGSIITCLVLSTKVVSLIPLSASLSFCLQGIRSISIKLGIQFFKQRLWLFLYMEQVESVSITAKYLLFQLEKSQNLE